MRTATITRGLIICVAGALLLLWSTLLFAAAVETPQGKRIPGRILDEADKMYRMETELPGGGRIIFHVDKDKVDPHGTVPGKGRIEDIKGTAEIKKVGRDRFAKAYKGMSVYPGDEIRTGPESEVIVTLEATAINGIQANSQFKLKNIEKNPETKAIQVDVDLPKGKLWSEVGRLKTDDSRFKIETPTAVTGVRGTVFLVEVAEEASQTNVSVLSGKVAVSSTQVDAPEVVLNRKEALVVKKGAEPSKLGAADLLSHITEIVKEWVTQSEYFKSASALAGIGQMEDIIPTGMSEEQRQLMYDSIQAGWEKASEDFFQIDKGLKMFFLDFGRFPTADEGGLRALVESTHEPQWNGPYIDSEYMEDHYGVPYDYKVGKDIGGMSYAEVTTYGYDKTPGTKDDRSKIIPEEDARRWEDMKSYR